MMKYKTMKKLLFAIIVIFIGLSGCKDFLDKTDPTATNFQEFFNDESDLRRVVYSSFRDVYTHADNRRTLYYMNAGRSDNAYSRNKGDHHQIVGNGNIDSHSRLTEYYYTLHMKHIGRINTYLANIDVPYVENESIRLKYENNLKGLRMWHYFQLTMRWGDVPYTEEPVTLEEATSKSTPKEQILDSLFTQGQQIANQLPAEEYTTDKFMFNKYSLKSLLMRYAL